jgi:hypothetical protein
MAGMGVRQSQKGCAILALAGALAALAGCRNDLDRDPQVGEIAGDGARLLKDPRLTLPVDPSTPGLEPPNTGSMDMPGGGAEGPIDREPPPNAPSAGGSAPVVPPPTSGAAGAGGAGGNGASAGTGGNTSPEIDAGTDAGTANPCESPECGLLEPCSDASLHCISLAACDHAVCIAVEAACQAQCNSDECALLESYPEQIACD